MQEIRTDMEELNGYIEPPKMKKPETDGHYIRPKAAESRMKSASGLNQTIWINGVSGCGKTSFVADYLKRKKYDYYSATEVLPSQVKIPEEKEKNRIVVIDDLYGIAEAQVQEEWEHVIQTMTEMKNVWLILVSRSAIPAWLYTLSVSQLFYRIDEKDFHLMPNQVELYFQSWGLDLKTSTMEHLLGLSRGFPLYVKILAMELVGNVSEEIVIEEAGDSFYKYMNSHVYNQWDTDICEVLMKLSILKEFDLDMAIYMTGNRNVNVLLTQAMELGNFMKKQGDYWIMREQMSCSMVYRLNQYYSMEYVRALYVQAGNCFRIKNKIKEALEMYEKAKDEYSIAELLIQNARENPGAGFFTEMKCYYMRLPEEFIKQSVELMGAMSMLQSMLLNEEESERWYQELKQFAEMQSGRLRKEARDKLLYLDIALPHRGNDNMLGILKNAGMLLLNRKAKLPEFSVTSNLPSQMNGGKDFCEWSKKDKEIAVKMEKILRMVLGKYGKAVVSLALAESGFEKGEDNYEVEMLAVRGRMEAESGGKIEQSFVAAALLAWLALFMNHYDHAIQTLEGFYEMTKNEKASPFLFKNYEAMVCRMALYQGDTAVISEWMKTAPNENEEFWGLERWRYLTKVRVYLSDHRYDEAEILLQKLDFYAKKAERTYIAMEVKMLRAILLYRTDHMSWKEEMQEAITRAEEYHFVRLLSREGVALLPLLKKGEFIWKNEEFRKRVEKETSYMAELYPTYLSVLTENATPDLPENALKILRLQALGKTTAEIADQLGISTATVKYHNRETYKKFGVQTKAQAVNEARNRRLI